MQKKIIDKINKRTMKASVDHYNWLDELTPPEIAALSVVGSIEGEPILDIGVGGGRTVQPLLNISNNYIGLDYVEEMVDECKSRFPDVTFLQGDARDMKEFGDNSFKMILFSMNGISMVSHQCRIDILKEVHRLLKNGGYFLFSTYNLNNAEYKKILQFPVFYPTINPLKLGVRCVRHTMNTAISIANRVRFKKHEYHCEEYSIINDKCHNYATMLYYISKDNQHRQLIDAGFDKDIQAFDLNGNLIINDTLDDSIFYVAKKSD